MIYGLEYGLPCECSMWAWEECVDLYKEHLLALKHSEHLEHSVG